MKKYLYIIPLAILLGLVSCVDTRYDEVINDKAYFPKSDFQEETLNVMNAEDYVYDIWIHKAGFFQEKFVGRIELDYNYLVKYNLENGTSYQMLDEKYFSFENDFVIEKGVDEIAVPLTLKTESIINEIQFPVTVYIPFSVVSLTPDTEVYVEKSQFILAFTFKQPLLQIDREEHERVIIDYNESSSETRFDITAMLDVKTSEDLEITYSIDGSLLPVGEKLLTKGYTFSESVVMPADEQYADNSLVINPDELDRGRWTLPIRMSSPNTKVKTEESTSVFVITVIKGNLDEDIILSGDDVQGNEVILASDDLEFKVIGNLAEGLSSNDYEVSIKGDNTSWLSAPSISEEGKIFIQANTANNTTNVENVATLVIHDNVTLLDKEVTIRQCMPGFGVVLNKSLWKEIILEGGYLNSAPQGSKLEWLFDGKWSTQSQGGLFIEMKQQDNSENCILMIDLGDNIKEYNHVGLMPRLDWTQPSPGKILIEVSSDKSSWTQLVTEQTYYEQSELYFENEFNNGKYWEKHFNDVTAKLIDLESNRTERYIKIIMPFNSSFAQSYGKFICSEEVFVSNIVTD